MSGLNLSRLRVLVVDDNRLARDMMKFALQALNTNAVATADSGARALRMLEEFAPDLVLLDWVMQPLDGLAFLKRLRGDADNPLRFVPVVMVTAYSEVWRVQEARDAGANEFVVKPFSAHTLYSRIKNLVEHPRPYVEDDAFFAPTAAAARTTTARSAARRRTATTIHSARRETGLCHATAARM